MSKAKHLLALHIEGIAVSLQISEMSPRCNAPAWGTDVDSGVLWVIVDSSVESRSLECDRSRRKCRAFSVLLVTLATKDAGRKE